MAQSSGYCYEDFAQQVSSAKLDLELDSMHDGVDKHLIAIATELEDWQQVAPYLNIKHRVVKDIITIHPNDPELQR